MEPELRLDDELCFALYSASRAATNAYRDALADLGLTYTQFVTMLALWEDDGAMGRPPCEEISDFLDCHESHAVHRLDGLSAQVRRHDDTVGQVGGQQGRRRGPVFVDEGVSGKGEQPS